MHLAFIGVGQVGAPLADQLQRLGHDVVVAARDPGSASVRKVLERNPRLRVTSPQEAVAGAEVVFLATPWEATAAALEGVAGELEGKILIDCTNPVGPNISHGLNSELSGTEVIQTQVPGSRVVKAFTIYGFENFEHVACPDANLKPAMLYCGNDKTAKERVAPLIRALGWEPLDVGGLEQALHLEHMTLLWVRLVRVNGHSPDLVWAALRR